MSSFSSTICPCPGVVWIRLRGEIRSDEPTTRALEALVAEAPELPLVVDLRSVEALESRSVPLLDGAVRARKGAILLPEPLTQAGLLLRGAGLPHAFERFLDLPDHLRPARAAARDRRTSPRIRVRTACSIGVGDEWLPAWTVDTSAGGMRVDVYGALHTLPAVGSAVRVRTPLRECDARVIRAVVKGYGVVALQVFEPTSRAAA